MPLFTVGCLFAVCVLSIYAMWRMSERYVDDMRALVKEQFVRSDSIPASRTNDPAPDRDVELSEETRGLLERAISGWQDRPTRAPSRAERPELYRDPFEDELGVDPPIPEARAPRFAGYDDTDDGAGGWT